MAKPVIKFKTYRQAAAVGGKIYGVPNLGDPVVAEVTMQEVIDYAKLHNYSADTLSALLSQVIAGVGDLVARDGRPRMLSDLLKFEPVIKGTFDNLEQTVTTQKVLVRPRMLKEIKVALDPSNYAWQNENDTQSPRIISVAPISETYSEVSLSAFLASINNGEAVAAAFGWTFAGNKLCPNGWDETCSIAIIVQHGETAVHYERNGQLGCFAHNADDDATLNAVVVSPASDYTAGDGIAWVYQGETPRPAPLGFLPVEGDEVTFEFTRTTSSGDRFTVRKAYLLS